ncbi:MAG: hypothetical protein ABIQ93_13360, partial [Saprospiraceae bacterium]
FGDGFETMPRQDDPRYVYAMSQGGDLGLVDRQTGDTRYLKPLHPDGKTELRFNWNAALAQDPFRAQGIYFGSQFLHYSADLGQNWQIISPDLSTSDTAKLHQMTSGGLTMDATNAENHCTILAIAPSPVQSGLVWVGTDDGQLQLTRDAGKTWQNLAKQLPGCPPGAWIPAIEASPKNAGEAFVVVNNYRQNDWQPYLYHTTDFGKTWSRLVHPQNLPGSGDKPESGKNQESNNFCLSVAQDPETPNLLFLGTDQGLYISLNSGLSWQHWSKDGFPSVPVQDMKIQARDGDLVIGTFGRAIWILDNLEVLRSLARSGPTLLEQPFKVFPAQAGILAEYRSYDGPRFAADATYQGENKGTAVRIPVWVKPEVKEKAQTREKDKGQKAKNKKDEEKDKKAAEEPAKVKEPAKENEEEAERKKPGSPAPPAPKPDAPGAKKKEKATVVILSMTGDTLRRFKTELDTGFTNISWNLDTRGVRFPSNNEPDKDQLEPGGGPAVLPGNYRVVVSYRDFRDSTTVRVLEDIRLNVSTPDRQAKAAATLDLNQSIDKAQRAYTRLQDAEKTLKLVEDQFVNVPDSTKKEALKLGNTLRDSITALKNLFFQQKEPKGIQRDPDNLNAHLNRALGYIGGGSGAPNAATQVAIRQAKTKTDQIVQRINALFDRPWQEYRIKVEAVRYSLFKEFEKL